MRARDLSKSEDKEKLSSSETALPCSSVAKTVKVLVTPAVLSVRAAPSIRHDESEGLPGWT